MPRRSAEWSTESSCTRVARWISSTTAASRSARRSAPPGPAPRGPAPPPPATPATGRCTSASVTPAAWWVTPSDPGSGHGFHALTDVGEVDVHRHHPVVGRERIRVLVLLLERAAEPVQQADALAVIVRRHLQAAPHDGLGHRELALLEEAQP